MPPTAPEREDGALPVEKTTGQAPLALLRGEDAGRAGAQIPLS
jgi:hypothetical protein